MVVQLALACEPVLQYAGPGSAPLVVAAQCGQCHPQVAWRQHAELTTEASKTGKAAGALGAAGFAGYMAVLFLSICLWWALGNLIGNGWSALVVAAIWGVIGAVLYASGRKKLREVNPTPERTVDTLKNVPDALKGEVGGHR